MRYNDMTKNPETNEVEEVQQTHYYPFGGIIADISWGRDVQKRLYNGKELDASNSLYWYDYGARQYDATRCQFTGPDPLAEKYYPWNAWMYCGGDPVNRFDPDGRDWYIDRDETIQYSPDVHSQDDFPEGQKYLWKEKNKTKLGIHYRADGSIMYKNETEAYKRMWTQADKHYRKMGFKGGIETGGFILSDGRVLVLPEYKNNATTSDISGYGYSLSKDGSLKTPDATYKVLANIHTHQERTASALPSDEFLSDSDVGVSKQMGGLPVITIGHDNMVHGIIYNKQGKAEHFPFKSRNGLLNGSYRIYDWLTKTFGK